MGEEEGNRGIGGKGRGREEKWEGRVTPYNKTQCARCCAQNAREHPGIVLVYSTQPHAVRIPSHPSYPLSLTSSFFPSPFLPLFFFLFLVFFSFTLLSFVSFSLPFFILPFILCLFFTPTSSFCIMLK